MANKQYSYVVIAKSLTTFIPMIECDTKEQLDIAYNKIKSFNTGDAIAIVSGGTKYNDVPHYNDYTWN